MTKIEKLEKAGQMRLPGIEILMDLVFEVGALVAAVVKAVEAMPVARKLAAVIKATRTMITARVGGDLLTLGGELRAEYSQDAIEAQETVEEAIDGLNEDDTYTALISFGFEERLHFAH